MLPVNWARSVYVNSIIFTERLVKRPSGNSLKGRCLLCYDACSFGAVGGTRVAVGLGQLAGNVAVLQLPWLRSGALHRLCALYYVILKQSVDITH
jgi:hypothetical protein